ncbi:MAG: HIT family protein [Defluviitaleaceae bacterium]|nr:HIT family protein [Defluviitaleaceae bacterium]MCL2264227.1 HIT family protein [Defluviitaleaceae bacterium]
MDCLFCKIIAGEIPSYKVYEDENFLAILDRFPAVEGTVLVLTKRHAADMFDMDEAEASGVMLVAKRIAEKIKETLKPDGLNILQNNGKSAGQEIFHYHMHIIPRYDGDAVRFSKPPTDPPLEKLAETAQRLKL